MITQIISQWNNLELAKLIVGVLTPLSVVGLGFWVNRRLKKIEYLQWANQKVIEKRLKVYEEIAPLLNDILCYFTYIGCWKELTPPDVVQIKRKLDRIAYVNAPLLPPEFIGKYNEFMNLCFSTYSEWGRDALLRTQNGRRRQGYPGNWKVEWDSCFAPDNEVTEPAAIRKSYSDFLAFFASSLGVGVRSELHTPGAVPYNIY